ncbi:unnamed protein product (macronuclear) [Paramecium tetraurelia]|uniref:Uncharacterized protein n=1 Tax=Paramecium tetraurelia TaxID=5888 RepID=A0BE51_PARTE|nr:uncharacterized protein GSPATT00027850001 [Paramecium tetraurelia]CAK56818.1 unnamed protein product [Paramecium tetraurelia]|eukprot:XP_001424216.1 hypothetical protein (macronuclear) [Paramecium tetraurelia strain d4-2]
MLNSKKQIKLQLQREQKPFPNLHVIHIDENLQQLCKLIENQQSFKTDIQQQTKKVLKTSKTIITTNKQSSLIKFIIQNKAKIFQQKENYQQSAIFKSLIIKQSQPLTKPFMGSCREKKIYSVQYPRKLSTIQNKINNSFQDIQIGPWEEE